MGAARPRLGNHVREIMSYELNVNVQLDDDFLVSILTTAAEGGIHYWANYRVERNDELDVIRIRDIVDSEDREAFEPADVIPGDIARALQLVLDSPTIASDVKSGILKEAADFDSYGGCYIDASLADVIVQYALFGEVNYS